MSHNTTVQTNLNNFNDLTAALKDMGITYSTGPGLKTKSRWGSAPPVDADITFSTMDGDIVGLKKGADGNYSLVGDFYSDMKVRNPDKSTTRMRVPEFQKRLTQSSATNGVIREFRKKYSSILPGDIKKLYNGGTRKMEVTIRLRGGRH